MKRIISLSLVLILAISFSACGSKSNSIVENGTAGNSIVGKWQLKSGDFRAEGDQYNDACIITLDEEIPVEERGGTIELTKDGNLICSGYTYVICTYTIANEESLVIKNGESNDTFSYVLTANTLSLTNSEGKTCVFEKVS